MDNLFQDSNLDAITVVSLADAVHRESRKIQLPAFQRDAVWDEGRVELLWDSIVRGFPIGTMLFARSNPEVIIKSPPAGQAGYSSTRAPSPKTEFVIIDGQQRTNAIALGLTPWKPTHKSRLWVDLGPSAKRADKSVHPFHLCSWRRPWGEQATISLQRDALKKLNLRELPETEMRLEKTWPLRASAPVKFAELMAQLKEHDSPTWRDLLPEPLRDSSSLQIRPDLADFLRALRKSLNFKVPLFLTKEVEIDDLGLIFDRLNRQGIPLSAEDLFFSALKIKWPEAHDLVWQIYDDRETGRFMPPTKIVHLATRLVAAERKDGDIVSLNRDEFIRRFDPPESADGQSKDSYLPQLQALLTRSLPDDSNGRLTRYLRQARNALSYRPGDPTDPGLPSALLRSLRWRVWHAVTTWMATQDGEFDEFSRAEIIRYALLDHFFTSSNSTRLTRFPLQTAYEAKGPFPGREIYDYIVRHNLLDPDTLFTPDEYRARVMLADRPQWSILQNSRHLIMWVQREQFAEWFADFDPTLYRKDADLPYHADHILPRAYLNMSGSKSWTELPTIFKEWRGAILWSIGNIRYWPKGLNMSDGARNLRQKYLLGPDETPTPDMDNSSLRSFGLNTVADVRKASFVSNTELTDWELACNENRVKDWRNEERTRAFRGAVDARRVAAYSQFFEQVGFGSWLT